MEKNNKLNLLKGFACMGVVFIHITFPGMFGQIVKNMFAYAVPIFFMIAGYYAFGIDTNTVKRRLIKIVKIFLWAYTLFLAFSIVVAIKDNNVDVFFSTNFNWKTPIKYICFCTIDFAIPLWYLIAMSETYIIWYLIVKNKKEDSALKILPTLCILRIILISYCETVQLSWFWKINFITGAMPWFLLGYYIHTDKAEKLRNISSYKLIVLAIIGCIITVIPTAFSLPLKFNVVGHFPYALGLFILTLKNSQNSSCKIIEYIGEKLSLNIYIFHVLVGTVVNFIFKSIINDIYIYMVQTNYCFDLYNNCIVDILSYD